MLKNEYFNSKKKNYYFKFIRIVYFFKENKKHLKIKIFI